MPRCCMTAFTARAPPSALMPRAECGSVCPGAYFDRPRRGWRAVVAAWQLPGTASYSAYAAMVGPGPFANDAAKAVGIPPEPASTVNPAARRQSTYHAFDLYSRKAGSAKCQMTSCQSDNWLR